MARSKTRNVNINSELLREKIEKSGSSTTKLSSMLLDRGVNYINQCCFRGNMNETDLKKLCNFLDFNIEEIVIKEAPKVVNDKKPEINDKLDDKLDLLVVGLNTLYETQTTTNKLLESMLVEFKGISTKLERIEKRVNSVDSSNGQIVAKTMQNLEQIEEISKNIRETKSSIAIIKGRVTDIYNGESGQGGGKRDNRSVVSFR